MTFDAVTLTNEQRTLLEERAKFPLQFATALFFGLTRGCKTNTELNNATVSLVQLGGKQIGITNQHVVKKFRERRAAQEQLRCQVGNVEIDLERCLISESEALDIAVLDLSPVDVSKIRGSKEIPCQFHEPRQWPPEMPNDGEWIVFGGFPKTKREMFEPGLFEFGSVSSGGTEVQSVQSDVITCRIQIEQCVVSFDRDGRGLEDPAGISGSPVMVARQLSSGLTVFDMVGVVFEYHNEWDVLRIRPLSLIDTDGEIRT